MGGEGAEGAKWSQWSLGALPGRVENHRKTNDKIGVLGDGGCRELRSAPSGAPGRPQGDRGCCEGDRVVRRRGLELEK